MDKHQKQYFLRQQMKAIQKELGEGTEIQEEIRVYQDKLRKIRVSEEVKEELEKKISRLTQMHPESAETSVVRNYLDWMFELPWNKATMDTLDLRQGQEDPRRGPLRPGQGQGTDPRVPGASASCRRRPRARSSASSGRPASARPRSASRSPGPSGRKFVRISLGGVHDEAEIRGHRRTYVGALPGRIIQGIRRAGSQQPGLHARRGRQDRRGLPRRPVLGPAGGPRPRAEQHLHATTTWTCPSTCRR